MSRSSDRSGRGAPPPDADAPASPVDGDPAHPAFAPLTPVPGTLPGAQVDPDAVADTDPGVVPELDAGEEGGTIVGHAPAPSAQNRTVAGSIFVPGPPPIVQAISMKPPEPERSVCEPTPVAPDRPRVRRISQAMVRSFSTAPGALGYLAPPKAAAEAARRARLRRWLIAGAAAGTALVAALAAALLR